MAGVKSELRMKPFTHGKLAPIKERPAVKAILKCPLSSQVQMSTFLVQEFVSRGFCFTQCRRMAFELAGRLRLFRCPLQTAGHVRRLSVCAGQDRRSRDRCRLA